MQLSCNSFYHDQTEFMQHKCSISGTVVPAVEEDRDSFGFTGQLSFAGNFETYNFVREWRSQIITPEKRWKLKLLKRPLFILNRIIRL
jgi:hypothetical protein